MDEQSYSQEEIRDMGEKEFRKKFPSGWMELARYETLVLVIDALLESNPNREYTEQELAEQSGCSKKSVDEHLESLVRLGVVNKLEGRVPPRYSLNEKSPITQGLYDLNLTVSQVKDGELAKSISKEYKKTIPAAENAINTFGSSQITQDTRYHTRRSVAAAESGEDATPSITPGATLGAD